MGRDSLSITDNRTGKQYEIPIEEGTIRALDLRQIKADADDFGLMTYDPAFTNTAACRSRVGDPGRRSTMTSSTPPRVHRTSLVSVAGGSW